MNRSESDGIQNKPKRLDWGSSNIAYHQHADTIRELLSKRWTVRLIWENLRDNHGLKLSYSAFRKGVAKWTKEGTANAEGAAEKQQRTTPEPAKELTRAVFSEERKKRPDHGPDDKKLTFNVSGFSIPED